MTYNCNSWANPMRYLLCFIFPPLPIFLCGKPFTALIAVPLTIFYFPMVILSLMVVASHKADLRTRMMAQAFREAGKEQAAAADRQTRAIDRQSKAIDRQTKASLAAAAAQTKILADAIRSRELPPAPEQYALPVNKQPISVEDSPQLPGQRRIRWSDVFDSILVAKQQTKEAYLALPEWAQPIIWGCAAATPLSIIMVFFFMRA